MGKQKHDPPVPTWVLSVSCLMVAVSVPMMVLAAMFGFSVGWGVATGATVASGNALSLAFGKPGWAGVVKKLPWGGGSDR